MPSVNKISVFDACVNANLDNFKSLINPWYNEFNQFYKTYKDTFDGKNDSVDNIIFTKAEDSSITFTVVCSDDVTLQKSTNSISVEKEQDRYKFTVHSNKAQC